MSINPKGLLLKKNSIIFYSTLVIFFDFLVYFYLAETLSVAFFPETMDSQIAKLQTLGVFAAGYVARPVGGFLIGRYGDRQGRKRALMLSVSIVAITSLVTACLPTYAQAGMFAPLLFLIARLTQGMAFGAYSVLSWVYIGEHSSETNRGLYMSSVVASFLVSVLLTVLIFQGIFNAFSHQALNESTWRTVFFCSSAFAFISVILISYLKETPVFKISRKQLHLQREQSDTHSQFDNNEMEPSYKRLHSILLTILLSLYISSLFIVVALKLPDLVSVRFSIENSMLTAANAVGIIFFILGTLFYGMLCQKNNVGKVLMIGSVIVVTQMFAFYYSLQNGGGDYILIMYALLGFSAGVISLGPFIMLHLFNTQNRLLSISVIYNTVYAIVGGLLPIFLMYSTSQIAFSPVLYITFVSFVGFLAGFYVYRLPSFNALHKI